MINRTALSNVFQIEVGPLVISSLACSIDSVECRLLDGAIEHGHSEYASRRPYNSVFDDNLLYTLRHL